MNGTSNLVHTRPTKNGGYQVLPTTPVLSSIGEREQKKATTESLNPNQEFLSRF
jgi:hypothetical protein